MRYQFLGREISKTQDYSEQTAERIDVEVKAIILRNYDKAKKILTDKIQTLHALAEALIQREVLDGAEVDMIVEGKTLADVDAERRKCQETLKAQNDAAAQAEAAKKDQKTAMDIVSKPARA